MGNHIESSCANGESAAQTTSDILGKEPLKKKNDYYAVNCIG